MALRNIVKMGDDVLRKVWRTQMTFDEKKLVAAEFIERILLDGEHVNICWKI